MIGDILANMEIENRKVIKVGSTEIDLIARRRNELMMGKYRLSLQAQRLFLYVLSQVQDAHDEDTEYEFAVSDLARAIGIDGSRLYKTMVDTLEELARTIVVLPVIDGEGKAVPNTIVRVGLVKNRQQVRFVNDGEMRVAGAVTVSLYKELLPYVRQLKERYTEVELKYVFRLPSAYSLRLYDLLKSRAFTGRPWRVEREELRELLGVKPEEYKLWGDFRRKVLEKANEDINTHTDLAFDIEYVNAGRTVVELLFHLRKEGGNEVETLPGTQRHTVFKALLDLGLKAPVADRILSIYWDEDPELVRWHIAEAKRLLTIGKIKNAVGWFLAGIKKDFRPNRSLFASMRKKASATREAYAKKEVQFVMDDKLQKALLAVRKHVGQHNNEIGTN
jgi:hypothetical protein